MVLFWFSIFPVPLGSEGRILAWFSQKKLSIKSLTENPSASIAVSKAAPLLLEDAFSLLTKHVQMLSHAECTVPNVLFPNTREDP